MKRVSVGLSAVLVVGAVGVARADSLERHEATSVFAEGVRLHDQGREEEARIKFVEAYALTPSPNVIFALARAEQLTGRELEAMEHYRECLRHPDLEKKGAPGLAARARGYMDQLRKGLGRIAVDAPVGARVVVDRTRTVGEGPLAEGVDVKPGRHVVEARVGAKSAAMEVEVAAGEEVHVRPMRDDTPSPDRIAPRVEGGSAKVPIVVGLAAASIGAFAVGGGFFLGAGARDDDMKRLAHENPSCPPPASSQGCRDLQDAVDARTFDRNAGRAFLVAGAGLLVAATATWLLWPEKRRTAGFVPYVAPHETAGGLGLGAVGHF